MPAKSKPDGGLLGPLKVLAKPVYDFGDIAAQPNLCAEQLSTGEAVSLWPVDFTYVHGPLDDGNYTSPQTLSEYEDYVNNGMFHGLPAGDIILADVGKDMHIDDFGHWDAFDVYVLRDGEAKQNRRRCAVGKNLVTH